MPRPLLPPRGIFVPTALVYDPELPAAVRDTWVQLRGLAWGSQETPSLSLPQLSYLLGKKRTTLYGHMRLLQSRDALRWRPGSKSEIIVVFPQDGELVLSGFPDQPDPLPLTDSGDLIQNGSDPGFLNESDQFNLRVKDSAVRESGFPDSGMSRRQPAAPADLDPLVQTLAEVTGMHPGLNASRLARAARRLLKAGYTPGQVADLYGRGSSGLPTPWYARDWRGQKGQHPTPEQIEQTIAALSVPAEAPGMAALRRLAEAEGIDFDDL